jgi:hypothetical protein
VRAYPRAPRRFDVRRLPWGSLFLLAPARCGALRTVGGALQVARLIESKPVRVLASSPAWTRQGTVAIHSQREPSATVDELLLSETSDPLRQSCGSTVRSALGNLWCRAGGDMHAYSAMRWHAAMPLCMAVG